MGTKGGRYAAGKAAEEAARKYLNGFGFFQPLPSTRTCIVAAFAEVGITIAKTGFDMVRREFVGAGPIQIRKNIDVLRLYEVKTSGMDRKTQIDSDFKGMGFTLTGSERKNAEALGARYRFLLVNLLTEQHLECSLDDFFTKERARIYPTWSVHIKTGIYPAS